MALDRPCTEPTREPLVYIDNAEDCVDVSTGRDVKLSTLGINGLKKEIREMDAKSQLYGEGKDTDVLDSAHFQNSSSQHEIQKGHEGIYKKETTNLEELESSLSDAVTKMPSALILVLATCYLFISGISATEPEVPEGMSFSECHDFCHTTCPLGMLPAGTNPLPCLATIGKCFFKNCIFG